MKRNFVPAVVLIILGVLFLLNNLGVTQISLGALISKWWPAILILVGISMLLRSNTTK
jgi:cytochrome c biogenesis protein CcdA